MVYRRRLSADRRADSLERALSGAGEQSATTRANADFVALARMLRPAAAQSEAHRALVRSRMFRAASGTEAREGAGTHDGLDPQVHSFEVGGPLGETIRVADIEPLDAERLSRVIRQLNELVAENTSQADERRR